MVRFKQKVRGNRHFIARRFADFVSGLDKEFGEENVYIGHFLNVRSNGGTIYTLKYFDPRWLTYRLQARKGDALQYFFVKMDSGREPYIREFLEKYQRRYQHLDALEHAGLVERE